MTRALAAVGCDHGRRSTLEPLERHHRGRGPRPWSPASSAAAGRARSHRPTSGHRPGPSSSPTSSAVSWPAAAAARAQTSRRSGSVVARSAADGGGGERLRPVASQLALRGRSDAAPTRARSTIDCTRDAVGLTRSELAHGLEVLGRAQAGTADHLPQRRPDLLAQQRVGQVGQALEGEVERDRVELRERVVVVAVVGIHEQRGRPPGRFGHGLRARRSMSRGWHRLAARAPSAVAVTRPMLVVWGRSVACSIGRRLAQLHRLDASVDRGPFGTDGVERRRLQPQAAPSRRAAAPQPRRARRGSRPAWRCPRHGARCRRAGPSRKASSPSAATSCLMTAAPFS